MDTDKQIEKSNIRAGGIGAVNGRPITAIHKKNDGSVTLTIGALKNEEVIIEDAECEIVPKESKLLPNS